MKEIILSTKQVALVDDQDYDELIRFKWTTVGPRDRRFYVQACSGGQLMHRVIMKPRDGQVVDHINGNPLDNRRANLRLCTSAQNLWNARAHKDNKCGFKGVYFEREWGKYRAQIRVNNKKICLGRFPTAALAHAAYCKAADQYHGEFAKY